MDDHTYFLLHDADQKIRRAGLLIELHRLHMLQVKARRRDVEQSKLNSLIAAYVRLLNYRQGLLVDQGEEQRRVFSHITSCLLVSDHGPASR